VLQNHLQLYHRFAQAVEPFDFDLDGYQEATNTFVEKYGFQPFSLDDVLEDRPTLTVGTYLLIYRRPGTTASTYVDLLEELPERAGQLYYLHPLLVYSKGHQDYLGMPPGEQPCGPALSVVKITKTTMGYGGFPIQQVVSTHGNWEVFGTKYLSTIGALGILTEREALAKHRLLTAKQDLWNLLPRSWMPR
jgi:hypothetical protein